MAVRPGLSQAAEQPSGPGDWVSLVLEKAFWSSAKVIGMKDETGWVKNDATVSNSSACVVVEEDSRGKNVAPKTSKIYF